MADTYALLVEKAEKALRQVEERRYHAELRLEEYQTFGKFGIAFCKKLCKVISQYHEGIEQVL